MRKFIEDVLTLAGLLIAEAWFLNGYYADQPEFEAGLTFLGFLCAVLAKEPIRAKFSPTENTISQHDKDLFRDFKNVLPPNQITDFFKQQDFGASFLKSKVAPLNEFVQTWDTVDKEFLDKELEARRKVLYSLASDLAVEISRRTVPVSGGDHLSVFSDQQRAKGEPRPAAVIEDAKVLNELSTSFVPKYEEFVRFCKGKLEN